MFTSLGVEGGGVRNNLGDGGCRGLEELASDDEGVWASVEDARNESHTAILDPPPSYFPSKL